MIVRKLELTNFRNMESLCVKPEEGVNVLYGDNAQGKTNILEALWLFTGAKSFKGSSEGDFIRIGHKEALTKLDFCAGEREQEASICYKEKNDTSEKGKIFLNEVPLKNRQALSGHFCAMVFAPEHINLIKDGPSLRRKFLDDAMCQIRPKYALLLKEYNKALAQRNALLKDVSRHSELLDVLELWEDTLAKTGGKIAFLRHSYVKKLRDLAAEVYMSISEQKEKLSIAYEAGEEDFDAETHEKAYKKALTDNRINDIAAGVTQTGIHREDMLIDIDNLSARTYASQGQRRSGALALKLAEAALLEQTIGETPVCLLDDVMSELDQSRQNYILNHIKGFQVFITCCDPAQIVNKTQGRLFKIQNGNIMP